MSVPKKIWVFLKDMIKRATWTPGKLPNSEWPVSRSVPDPTVKLLVCMQIATRLIWQGNNKQTGKIGFSLDWLGPDRVENVNNVSIHTYAP
jgi:hypothetical protein